jgi:CheY-like chemotaxis protein
MNQGTDAAAVNRVLVVEDNPDSRHSLRVLLEMWGYEVEEAEDGGEGVRKALDWRPRAAVVDIGLPVCDGYEVARQVKKVLSDDILLIALTAYGGAEDRRRAFRAGFAYHLTKPADPSELSRLLSSA